ncbi:MAG: helix-turn-helix transcriptional regulator [Gammaproteobacteria bacterium]|nr:helix-turn-helix transcriptional regulator [Gammaproteobacteria bacterium]
MKVNEKIRLMREMNDWTQEDMAEKMSMSLNSYSKLERGESKLYLDKLEKVAEVFDVEINDLLSLNKQGLIFLVNKDISGDNSGLTNYYGCDEQLSFEIEKQKIMLNHKDEIIKQKDELISQLYNQIELLKQN